ncbi:MULTISPECIES: hypothetical protein [Flavobacterium]|uniref:Uncharacterized protein n=1 Tax=Flavobacterium columnare TaxID=996 RepID=A0AA94EZQ3_9FLAO|nr:hypothetical protein [Flavobacterium columnare]MCH4830404.1 hypothetical protein [Flavobacterium columnare]MCH4833660.1 hypothetical protein [Flavobacterium columnare]
MDTLKYISFFLISLNFSCSDNSKKHIKSEIWVSDWNNKSIPKTISLLSYDKNKTTITYKVNYTRIAYDTLNKNKYLLIKFKSTQNKLSTSNKYELKINDTIYYKIYDFKTRSSNQGGDIEVKVNNGYSEIGDSEILVLDLKSSIIIKK